MTLREKQRQFLSSSPESDVISLEADVYCRKAGIIMDIDFWTSKVHSSKHFSAVQASRLNSDNHNSIGDETERDDDVKACFPCPFCYLEIEIHMICSHLQEEHCFELKHAVCPLCAANLGKDAAEHFIVQHGSSLKRRRKSLKSGFWNGGSAMLGKELSSFIGSSTIGRGNAHESLPDPLLSPFLCSGLVSDTKGIQKDDCSQEVSVPSDLKSVERTLLDNEREENVEEKRQRATFVQQLIMSTVF